MFDLLLYSGIHCTDASDIIRRMEAKDNMNEAVKAELIEVIQDATPECNWDAND
jgi:endonuclease V-like protein UPF0215 family|tara:strand:- start:27 stop:188 length:162 start_codon:yes stop_codon:yes gene_type:complete